MTGLPVARPVDALVSYHYISRSDRMAKVVGTDGLFRIIADSGAFSAYTQGATIDLDAYAGWLKLWRPHLFWAASLDVFGDPARTFANWRTLRDRHQLDTVPTVHIGTDLKWVDAYAVEGVDFLGLGGMVGQDRGAQLRFLVHVLRYARDHHPHLRFHAWGTTTHTMLARVPIYSADSSGLLGRGFRFGEMPLWDSRTRQIVNVAMDGRTPWRHRRLLVEEYDTDPADVLRSTAANRPEIIALTVRAVQARARSYQDIHRVTPPSYAVWQPAEIGPRLHFAENDPRDYVKLRDALNQQKEGGSIVKDVILLSGGLDSTAALALAHNGETAARAVVVDYGQRHVREIEAAQKIATRYGIPLHILDFRSWGVQLHGSALTDPSVPVPHGHYAAPTMAATIVPNRNAVLLMAAVGIADAYRCDRVITAVHAGDHPVYPDCRPEFIAAATAAASFATEGRVAIYAPFVNHTKADIARIAYDLGAPVGLTWSCYEGGELHCGACGTCTERKEAFERADREDPTIYVDTPGDDSLPAGVA